MSLSVFILIALLLLAGCVGTTAPPALVLQLSQITRARATEGDVTQRRELAFTASLSVGLETAAMPPLDPRALDPPMPDDPVRCDPVESALCAWMRAAEESAWLAALEHAEASP